MVITIVQHWSENGKLGSQSIDHHDCIIKYIHMVFMKNKIRIFCKNDK